MTLVSGEVAVADCAYAAFISYNHQDRKWAQWLHRAIENFSIPRDIVAQPLTRRSLHQLKPVFIDRAELPTSADLAASVREALEKSAYLLVVCSPDAVQSRWVNEEIRLFRSLGRSHRVLCLIVAGDPAALSGAGAANDCFPPALREGGADPLAADVRPGMDGRRVARLKLLASLLAVPLDSLVNREHARRQRRLVLIAGAAIFGCLVLAVLALVALYSRDEAQQQRRIAEQRSLTAQRTADFLKSLFAVSDPSEARGRTITAREVLDRGAQQIKTQLRNEPAMRAELATTLGEVYTGLGLLQQGTQLLSEAQSLPAQPVALAVRQAVALGEAQFGRGDLPAALTVLNRAVALLAKTPHPDAGMRIRVFAALGDVQVAMEDYAAARTSYQAVSGAAAASADSSLVSRVAEGLAECDLFEKNYDAAQQGFERALAAQVAASGELHPRAAYILNNLGSLAYLRGNRNAAEGYFRRTLAIDSKLFGERNPEVAATRENLARVLLERRQFTEARTLLRESLAARSVEVLDTDEQMAFFYSNLALAEMGMRGYPAALAMFSKGLRSAILHQHRLHGPILTDLADLECRMGRYQAGLDRLVEARPIVTARYADDPWRTAHVDNVRAGCLTGFGRYPEATRLMASSLPIILKKWPPNTLFGHDALERAVRLYTHTGEADRVDAYRAQLQEK